MNRIKYIVTWKEDLRTDLIEFDNYNEAIKFAKMKKDRKYDDVKMEKVEYTEIEF
jgi:hypothetical protein